MQTITHEVTLVITSCVNCGIPFGIPDYLDNSLRENHNGFFCPNGHTLVYRKSAKDSKIEKLEKELRWAEEDAHSWRAEAEAKARSLSATKGVLTKTKKRIANGVCPCCHRQFTNLHRHMENQHPEYAVKE